MCECTHLHTLLCAVAHLKVNDNWLLVHCLHAFIQNLVCSRNIKATLSIFCCQPGILCFLFVYFNTTQHGAQQDTFQVCKGFPLQAFTAMSADSLLLGDTVLGPMASCTTCVHSAMCWMVFINDVCKFTVFLDFKGIAQELGVTNNQGLRRPAQARRLHAGCSHANGHLSG